MTNPASLSIAWPPFVIGESASLWNSSSFAREVDGIGLSRKATSMQERSHRRQRRERPSKKPDGRYDVNGDDLYYILQHYTTKPIDQGRFESHRKYIDIQILLAGQELLGYSPTTGLEVVEPYSEEKDIMFYRVGTIIAQTKLEPGLFCLLFPHDAHLPSCHVTCPAPVHKIVFKIRVGK